MTAPPGLEERLKAAADAMPEAPVELERVLMTARRRQLLGALVVLAIAAGLVVLLSLGGEAAKRALNARVPNVHKLSQEDAVEKLHAADLRHRVVRDCPAGVRGCVVLHQAPEKGTTVEPHSRVDLTVGKAVRTPKVLGLRQERARRELEERRLKPAVARSCGVPICLISAQDPAPGSETAIGSAVTLTLSPGGRVPEVKGLSASAARERLVSAGFNDVSFTAPCRERATCRVGEQTLKPRVIAPLDSRVTMTLYVLVPSVEGGAPKQARTRLEAAGLVVEEKGRCAKGSSCSIVMQRPEAGKLVPDRTRVTITKGGERPETSVPDVVGKTEAVATDLIEAKRLRARPDRPCPVTECVVIKQDPPAGEQLPIEDEVTLTLGVLVPGLEHTALEDARKQLEDAGLVPVTTTNRCTTTEHCRVVTQNPKAGDPVALDSEVAIEAGDEVRVPDVEGDSEKIAVQKLRRRGLRRWRPDAASTCKPGTGCMIEKQDPPADDWIDPKTTVVLTLVSATDVPS